MQNKNAPAPILDAPIPGQGMTAPLGDRPWQRPPQFTTPEQALEFYVNKISQDKQVDQMLDILELGVPVDTLVDTLQLGGVMEGLHSVDVGMLIAPALVEVISGIGEKAGIDFVTESQEEDSNVSTPSEIALNMQKLKDKKEKGVMLTDEISAPEEEVTEDMTEEKPSGLMARRT